MKLLAFVLQFLQLAVATKTLAVQNAVTKSSDSRATSGTACQCLRGAGRPSARTAAWAVPAAAASCLQAAALLANRPAWTAELAKSLESLPPAFRGVLQNPTDDEALLNALLSTLQQSPAEAQVGGDLLSGGLGAPAATAPSPADLLAGGRQVAALQATDVGEVDADETPCPQRAAGPNSQKDCAGFKSEWHVGTQSGHRLGYRRGWNLPFRGRTYVVKELRTSKWCWTAAVAMSPGPKEAFNTPLGTFSTPCFLQTT